MDTLEKNTKLPKERSMTENFWDIDTFENPDEPRYPVNIRETDSKYELEVAVPNFRKKDFKVTTENGILSIMAECSKNKSKTGSYIRKEFSHASFTGSFRLPENIAEDHILAKYRKGLFTISLKKSDQQGKLLKKHLIKIR
jgi:HSP20 family protein